MKKPFHKLALTVLVVLAACSDIVGFGTPLEYEDGVKYFDEPLFRPLWNELKSCSKLSGSLSNIDFYYVPLKSFPSELHGIRTVGLYFPRSNRIFIVESERWNPTVIRHEMMHALLRDESGHPPQYFGSDGLCGYI